MFALQQVRPEFHWYENKRRKKIGLQFIQSSIKRKSLAKCFLYQRRFHMAQLSNYSQSISLLLVCRILHVSYIHPFLPTSRSFCP